MRHWRVFRFLVVKDPKQTDINILFFCLIFAWIGLGTIVNAFGQLWYYGVTLPKWEASKILESSLIQVPQSWMDKIVAMEVPGVLFAVFLTLACTIVWKLWKAYQEVVKEIAPVVRELKTLLFLKSQ